MNIDRLHDQFSNESICGRFFESARWPDERICPHCGFNVSYRIRIKAPQVDRFECKRCKRHFTVTTKTVLHNTKLPLRKWLQAMYLIVSSSKGISSVVLARLMQVDPLIGISIHLFVFIVFLSNASFAFVRTPLSLSLLAMFSK
jgi:DNA-directed RNA polymerase subunit RPC12/RpoP